MAAPVRCSVWFGGTYAEFDSAKLGHEGRNSFVNENTLDIL